MAVFAVILNEHEEASTLQERIEKAYPEPDHIAISSSAWLLSGDLLVNEIAEKLGMHADAESPLLGTILRLNGTYSGLQYSSVWDWLARSTQS